MRRKEKLYTKLMCWTKKIKIKNEIKHPKWNRNGKWNSSKMIFSVFGVEFGRQTQKKKETKLLNAIHFFVCFFSFSSSSSHSNSITLKLKTKRFLLIRFNAVWSLDVELLDDGNGTVCTILLWIFVGYCSIWLTEMIEMEASKPNGSDLIQCIH